MNRTQLISSIIQRLNLADTKKLRSIYFFILHFVG